MASAKWVSHKLQAEGIPVLDVIEPGLEDGAVAITMDLYVSVPRGDDYCHVVKIDANGVSEVLHPAPISQIIEELKAETATI